MGKKLRERTEAANRQKQQKKEEDAEKMEQESLAKLAVKIQQDLERGQQIIQDLEKIAGQKADKGDCRCELLQYDNHLHATTSGNPLIPIRRLRPYTRVSIFSRPKDSDYMVVGYNINPNYLAGAAKLVYEFCITRGFRVECKAHEQSDEGGDWISHYTFDLVWCDS